MKGIGQFAGIACVIGIAAFACDDPPPKQNPFENPEAPKQPPPIKETPKPQGPPDFQILAEGPKIGWTNILLEKKDGPKKLRAEIADQRQFVNDKVVNLTIDRKAKLSWVAEMLTALDEAGATGFEVTTKSRPELPKTVGLTPLSDAKGAPGCSVVGKVLEERRNAVWHLKGGTAVRSPKGLAGPDLAMTGENIQRAALGCKESKTLFVSADEGVEWGLVYDLAAVAKTLEKASFDKIALLPVAPVAGRPVEIP